MDPIALVSLVGQATRMSWEIVIIIRESVQEVRKVDENLQSFSHEVDGLRRLLISITTSLNDPNLGLAEVANDHNANRDMWEAIFGGVEDCHNYLQKLCEEIMPLQASEQAKSVFSKAVRALKLQLNKDDINKIRDQIQVHQMGLNTALQMLNVYVCMRLPMQMQDSLGSKINGLGDQIAQLQSSIDRRPEPADSEGQNPGHVSSTSSVQLKKAAENLRSNASVISAARSTQWGGSERHWGESEQYSVMGEPLSPTGRNEIERWMSLRRSETISQDLERSETITPTSTEPSSVFTRNTQGVGAAEATEPENLESDSEGEIDFELSKRLMSKGDRFYSQTQYREAVAIYQKALRRSEHLSAGRRSKLNINSAKLNLARSFLQVSDYEQSESMLLGIARENSTQTSHLLILDSTFALSDLYFRKTRFDEAESYCRKALKGSKRVHGKAHPKYYDCLRHLVAIHEAKNEHDEAQAVSELLPSDGPKRQTSIPVQSNMPQRKRVGGWSEMIKDSLESEEGAPSKGENVQRGCIDCREAGLKCSKERPRCQQCKGRQLRCVYSDLEPQPTPRGPISPSRADFASLEDERSSAEIKPLANAEERSEGPTAQTATTLAPSFAAELENSEVVVDLRRSSLPEPRVVSPSGTLSTEQLKALTDAKGRLRNPGGLLREEMVTGKLREAESNPEEGRPTGKYLQAHDSPKEEHVKGKRSWRSPFGDRLKNLRPVIKPTGKQDTSTPAFRWQSSRSGAEALQDTFKIADGPGAVQCYSRYVLDRPRTRPSNAALITRDKLSGTPYQHLIQGGIPAGKLFMMAMNFGHLHMLETLLDFVDLNAPLDDGAEPALLHAAGLGRENIRILLVFLVQRGAYLNAVDHRGFTALMIAVEAFSVDDLTNTGWYTQTLLDLGADISHRAPSGETAVSLALRIRGGNTLRRMFGFHALGLYVYGMHNLCDAEGRTWLHYAAVTSEAWGPDVRAESLLRVSHPVDVKDVYGMTPLMIAAQVGRSKAARELVDAGATLDARDRKGRTALMIAVSERHFDVAWALIRWADDQGLWKTHWPRKIGTSSLVRRLGLSCFDVSGRTALMTALFWRNAELAKALIALYRRERLSMDTCDKFGLTALHFAARAGFGDIVSELVESGSDVDKRSEEDETALLSAAQEGHVSIVQNLLPSTGTAMNQKALFFISQQRRYDACWNRNILTSQRDYLVVTHLRDEYGCSLLMEATAVGNANLVDLLLQQGENLVVQQGDDLKVVNETGESVVDIAIRRKNPHVTHFVLARCRRWNIPFETRGYRPMWMDSKFPVAALPERTSPDKDYQKLAKAKRALLRFSDVKSTALVPNAPFRSLGLHTLRTYAQLAQALDGILQAAKRDAAKTHHPLGLAAQLTAISELRLVVDRRALKFNDLGTMCTQIADIQQKARSGSSPGCATGTRVGGPLTSRNLRSLGSSPRAPFESR